MKRWFVLFATLFVLLPLTAFTASASQSIRAARTDRASSSVASLSSGWAYGAYTTGKTGSTSLISGPISQVGFACDPLPTTDTNSASLVEYNSAINAGSATSTLTVSTTSASNSIEASADIEGLKLFNGLISAGSIHTDVTSTATASGGTSSNNSIFSGLSISGASMLVNPAPNTKVTLPGIGYVVLNEQHGPFDGAASTSISVNALDVHITAGPSAGTNLLIGHAESSESITAQPLTVRGAAYGFYSSGPSGTNASSTIGPMGYTEVSCIGGTSSISSNGLSSSQVGNTGAIHSSATGKIVSSGGSASGQTTMSASTLLKKLIDFSTMALSAQADITNGAGSCASSMTLTNGSVNGKALNNNPAPGTRIDLPGIGYVIVNEVVCSNNSSVTEEGVIGFDINVTMANSLGLPIGDRILIGVSYARVATY